MTNGELDELERLAKAATQGAWYLDTTNAPIPELCIRSTEKVHGLTDVVARHTMERDGFFIAAANPIAILELIQLVRDAQDPTR